MHLAAAAATFLAFIASASADRKRRSRRVRNFGGQSGVDDERVRVVHVVTFVAVQCGSEVGEGEGDDERIDLF